MHGIGSYSLRTEDAAVQSSSNSWTEEEKNKLIELEKDPLSNWENIAKNFRNKTAKKCKECWREIFQQILFPEKPKEYKTSITGWNQKEKKQFTEFKTKYPHLEFARIAVRLNKTETQCQSQWKVLRQKLNQPQATEGKIATVASSKQFASQDQDFLLSLAQAEKTQFTEPEEQINLEKLIQLEQNSLSWQEIAEFFPNTTYQDCQKLWKEKVFQPYIDQKNQKKEYEIWSLQENEKMSALMQTRPRLSWDRIAIRMDKKPQQCHNWSRRKRPAEENNSGHSSKKQRTENSSFSYPFNPYLVNLPSLEDIQKIFDPILFSYASAITHFKEIQVMVPMLAGYQEDILLLANIQMTYEEIKQKLKQKECSQEIVQKISDINQVVNWCHLRNDSIELLYQHFSSYQIDPQDKEWFMSQGQEFGTLYLDFLKGSINKVFLRQQILFKERDYYYQKSKSVFKFWEDSLQSHSYKLSLRYQNHITNLFNSIHSQLELLKTDPEWLSKNSLLTKTSERLQEIETFFQNTAIIFSPFLDKLDEIESNIIARINDEITSEDFQAKQTAIEKTEASLKMTVQNSNQDFYTDFNPNAFDDLFNT